MPNAVFNSMEDSFNPPDNSPDVRRSVFDLSHLVSFDCDFGALIPFYLEDCLPSDRFEIKNAVRVQALPLSCPLWNNIRVNTYYFYVPYYLLWHKFDRFLSGGRDGTYTCELPYVSFDSSSSDPGSGPNTLADYLGFPVTDSADRSFYYTVSAFPFAAYQRIYRDYFMSQDNQTDSNVNSWFPADDLDFCLTDGTNSYMAQDVAPDFDALNAINDPGLKVLRYRNFRKDYFTSAMFSPQRGPAQAVPSTGFTFPDSSLVTDGADVTAMAQHYNIAPLYIASNNKIFGVSNTTTSNKENIQNVFSSGSSGFTVSDLHLAVQLQRWFEKNMRVKAQYNEFLRVHFGDAPIDERLTKPYYIGGTSQVLTVSDVMQTSATTETSPQGTITGNGNSFDTGYIGRFQSHEYGLIMGIMSIMPDVYYNEGLNRHWTKSSRFDFYFPEFADLEPQAILNKELYMSDNDDTNNSVFGYIGYADEYRHHRSMVCGSLRNPNTTDFSSWVITRNFKSTPTLNSNSFISSCKQLGSWKCPPYTTGDNPEPLSTISHNAWASGYSVNPFMVQVGLSITANRPLPYVSDPSEAKL